MLSSMIYPSTSLAVCNPPGHVPKLMEETVRKVGYTQVINSLAEAYGWSADNVKKETSPLVPWYMRGYNSRAATLVSGSPGHALS